VNVAIYSNYPFLSTQEGGQKFDGLVISSAFIHSEFPQNTGRPTGYIDYGRSWVAREEPGIKYHRTIA